MQKRFPSTLIVAHRGYSSKYPENTLAAFTAAADAGAHMIELDVCLSRDRRLVVIHDDTVDRTTSGTGAVKTLSWRQLSRLDAGSWFDPSFSGEKVPSLEQVLDAVKGRLLVNIEIKPEAFEGLSPADAVERQVMALVREKQMTDDVLVSSFEWQILENIRQLDPDIALGLLSDTPADESLLHWHQRIDGFSWHPDYRILTRAQVDTLHAIGAKVFPYAVKGKIDIGAMLAMGVDGLIIDDPAHMVSN